MRSAIFRRIDKEPEDDLLRRLKVWVSKETTNPVSERVVHVTVDDVMHLWQVRLKLSEDRGTPLYGAAALLSRLAAFKPTDQLEQVALKGPDTAGNIFFLPDSGAFIGAVLFDKMESLAKLSRAS